MALKELLLPVFAFGFRVWPMLPEFPINAIAGDGFISDGIDGCTCRCDVAPKLSEGV
jgi:hypothetical protein